MNLKTPDEIKKGLECCASFLFDCPHCSYYEVGDGDCVDEVKRDALHYIQQLEAERDAAINALKNGDVCEACKHFGTRMDTEPCAWCGSLYSNFEWRGVQKEE